MIAGGKAGAPWPRGLSRTSVSNLDLATDEVRGVGKLWGELFAKVDFSLGVGVASQTVNLFDFPREHFLLLGCILRIGNGTGGLSGGTAWSNASSASKNVTLSMFANDGSTDRAMCSAVLGTWAGNNYDYANDRSIYISDKATHWFFKEGDHASTDAKHHAVADFSVWFNRVGETDFDGQVIKLSATRAQTDGVAVGSVEARLIALPLWAKESDL